MSGDEPTPAAASHKSQQDAKSSDSSGVHNQTPVSAFDTQKSCTECGEADFDRSELGEWYCHKCGAVHTRTELEFSEPGWLAKEEQRTGPTSSLARVDIGTAIGDTENQPNPYWTELNKRLEHSDETLRHGLRELRALASSLAATDILVEQAAYLFRQAAKRGLLIGHSLESMAAACIHATARKNECPFPLAQIAAVSPVDIQDIKSAYSKLVREFDLKIVPPIPTVFISRFVSEAGLSIEVEQRANDLADEMIDKELHVGQSPTGFAAAIVYGAAKRSGEQVTQETLSSIAYVGVVTISRQWQRINEKMD